MGWRQFVFSELVGALRLAPVIVGPLTGARGWAPPMPAASGVLGFLERAGGPLGSERLGRGMDLAEFGRVIWLEFRQALGRGRELGPRLAALQLAKRWARA